MRKVIFGYGLFDTYKDSETFLSGDNADIIVAPKQIRLMEITPPEEIKAREKYLTERMKAGNYHPLKRPRAK